MSSVSIDLPDIAEVDEAAALGAALEQAVGEVVRGKPEAIRCALIGVLAEGHVLIDDNPGVGKTSLARALAAAMGGQVGRVQFTPDLLPADVTGGLVFQQHEGRFTFRAGPVFAHVVIADEINRASPKTQSALLEVMAEQQVTVDGIAYPTPRPFIVLATQNPVEMDGTYRLPEAQLDRFMLRLEMGYPSTDDEVDILRGSNSRSPDQVHAVASPDDIIRAIGVAGRVQVHEDLYRYIAELCAATRQSTRLRLGASPRGGIALLSAARSLAILEGRSYLVPEDVVGLAEQVLAHRMIAAPAALREGHTSVSILRDVMRGVREPGPGNVPRTFR